MALIFEDIDRDKHLSYLHECVDLEHSQGTYNLAVFHLDRGETEKAKDLFLKSREFAKARKVRISSEVKRTFVGLYMMVKYFESEKIKDRVPNLETPLKHLADSCEVVKSLKNIKEMEIINEVLAIPPKKLNVVFECLTSSEHRDSLETLITLVSLHKNQLDHSLDLLSLKMEENQVIDSVNKELEKNELNIQ